MNESIPLRLERYRRLRAVQLQLHHAVMEGLPREALKDCGMRLGIWRNGTLVFGTEDETSVLMDHCIYDYRWDGRNVIERYVAEAPPNPGTDEKILLDAMLQARYSLFEVEEALPGVGIRTRDLFAEREERYIVDIGLSQSATEGLVFACRTIAPADEGYSMTTGAGLPADDAAVGRILREISKRFGSGLGRLPVEGGAEFAACIIRILLEENASSHIAYANPIDHGTAQARSKTGRNDSCPCGSGKKYKRCCGHTGAI